MIHANDPMLELPEGFSELRRNVGSILKKRRIRKRMKQSSVAADARITPGTLSRIENKADGRLPRLETVGALLDVLGMEWGDVAVSAPDYIIGQGSEDGSDARGGNRRADQIQSLGPMIRNARRAAQKSLRALARECDMSAAQLSRVERGLNGDSRIFKDVEGWENEPREERVIEIGNAVIAKLVRLSP